MIILVLYLTISTPHKCLYGVSFYLYYLDQDQFYVYVHMHSYFHFGSKIGVRLSLDCSRQLGLVCKHLGQSSCDHSTRM